MKRLIPFVFILVSGLLNGQNNLEGIIHDLNSQKIYLLSFYGERSTVIDSTMADSSGKLQFVIKANRPPGMYRIQWGKDKLVDLLWNRENISFTTSSLNPYDSIIILASQENKIYYMFSKQDRINQSRLELLMPIVDFYPVRDTLYYFTAREMERIQTGQAQLLDSLDKLYPDSYAVRIFKLYQTPFLSAGLSKEDRLKLLQQHYFDNVNFNDTALLNSPVYANKAISYLALYSDNRIPKKQLETGFIKAVTNILSAASVNPEVFKFLLDYLIGGFDKYHFDEVIEYIAENFQDPFSCEDQQRKTTLQKKLENIKRISIGKIAPDVQVTDQKGNTIELSKIQSEYTLLIFWSSDCSHCTNLLPRLKELYDNQKSRRFEVFAVSIDTSRNSWNDFINKEKLKWINGVDIKGFAGRPADDYNIYATPTLFLLDKKKTIIAKPITYRETEQVLRDQNLIP